jgi:FKBP-type peptidyl-prolyl cis-trans isomerase FkpA
MTSSIRPIGRPCLLVAIVALMATAACGGGSPVSPVSVAFSQTDLRVGTGTEATAGKTVTVNYTGWFYDNTKTDNKGAQFDTSIGRVPPFSFVVGAGDVIVGFDRGCTGMRVGGLRRVVVPPSLGFGSAANQTIPANSTLVFEIEMVDVQ